MKRLIELGILACLAGSASAQAATHEDLSIEERASQLRSGQYVWEAEAASSGPLSVLIDLTRQTMLVYRGDTLIAASTISSGSKGRETPIGVFTVLQKEVMHRSRTYDDAPMPYMQRLTEKGVAMHAGNLPGYAASHGCFRLPTAFDKLLYGVTEVGTPVVVTDAEEQRRGEEYQLAMEDYARRNAELQADAERTLAEFDKAKAVHDEIVRQHKAQMERYRAQVAAK